MVIGTTFAPVIKRAREHGIPPWVTSIVLVTLMMEAAGVLVTLLAAPIAEWIGRAPEIGASLKQKLYVFDRPLAALRDLQNVLMPTSDKASRTSSSLNGLKIASIFFMTNSACATRMCNPVESLH